MTKYINNKTGKIAVVINNSAAGMCKETIGLTLVIYKYEDNDYDYPFVMEHRAFYFEHSEITN